MRNLKNNNTTTTISKATKNTKKQNGGNKMEKIRIYEAARKLGMSSQEMMFLTGKKHWFCTITKEEYGSILFDVSIKKMIKGSADQREKDRGGKYMYKYLINITKEGVTKKISDEQATAYRYLSCISEFEGKDISFGFIGMNCNGRSYFDVSQDYTCIADDPNARYEATVFRYSDADNNVVIHDGDVWTELCSNIKLFVAMKKAGLNASHLQDDIDKWTDILLSGKETGGIKEAVFLTDSLDVQICLGNLDYEQLKMFVDEMAEQFDLVLDKEQKDDCDISMSQPTKEEQVEKTTESSEPLILKFVLTSEEWDMLTPYVYKDEHGLFCSKRTGHILTHLELMKSLQWVKKRRANKRRA